VVTSGFVTGGAQKSGVMNDAGVTRDQVMQVNGPVRRGAMTSA